jgi:hypothetical protein
MGLGTAIADITSTEGRNRPWKVKSESQEFKEVWVRRSWDARPDTRPIE